MRNENDGVQAGGAGVGGHRCRGISGRDASHALHAQPQGLRRAAGHAVVLEGAGGVKALVLEGEAVKAGVGCRARRIEERRVALPQRDHAIGFRQKRDDLAVAPDAARIEREVTHPPFAPELLERRGVVAPIGINGFEQASAARAVIENVRDAEARAARGREADEFGRHEPLSILGPSGWPHAGGPYRVRAGGRA